MLLPYANQIQFCPDPLAKCSRKMACQQQQLDVLRPKYHHFLPLGTLLDLKNKCCLDSAGVVQGQGGSSVNVHSFLFSLSCLLVADRAVPKNIPKER